MKKFILLTLLFSALPAFASEFLVKAWRGETVYAEVPDNQYHEISLQHGKELNGVSIAFGALQPTPFRKTPHSSEILTRLDRFVLSSKSGDAPGETGFCRVSVSENAKSGDYVFGSLRVRVIDRILPPPSERKYFLDLWQHPEAIARFFNVKPLSNEHKEKMANVWRALAEAGQKSITTTLVDLPWNHQCYDGYSSMIKRVKKNDGSWLFNFDDFDSYVEFALDCGIGPDIACYTLCPWGFVVRWQDENGKEFSTAARPGTKEFEDFWGNFLVEFSKHLKEKNWFENTYLAMDERAPEDVRKIVDFVQEKAPGFKIAMAGNRPPSDFQGIQLENYSQILSDVTPAFLAELEARRAAKFKTTFYVCCAPRTPNTFMTSADDEAFWIGAYPALSGFDGFLRWAANSYPRNPYENASFGNWEAGDTFLIYPNGEPSARFLALRAGIIASEKIKILKEENLFTEEINNLAAKYPFDKALSNNLNFTQFRRDAEKIVNK